MSQGGQELSFTLNRAVLGLDSPMTSSPTGSIQQLYHGWGQTFPNKPPSICIRNIYFGKYILNTIIYTKNGLNFHNAYNPQKAIFIDLDEGVFYCIIFFFFPSKKKKSGYKGESSVSCLAQLEIPTRGKKKV